MEGRLPYPRSPLVLQTSARRPTPLIDIPFNRDFSPPFRFAPEKGLRPWFLLAIPSTYTNSMVRASLSKVQSLTNSLGTLPFLALHRANVGQAHARAVVRARDVHVLASGEPALPADRHRRRLLPVGRRQLVGKRLHARPSRE